MAYILTAGLAATLLSAAVPAQDPAPAVRPVPVQPVAARLVDAKSVAAKKVCRRVEATGSIFPTKTCHLPTEWAEIDARNSASADALMAQRTRSAAGRQ